MENKESPECFIIMPISDHNDYEKGHFKRVYEDIIIPACERAGFKAVRADEIEETDMIHISILKKIVEAPMAICDLSTRNPNVLFELGLRQAFDKPVVLIQEKGTERIFDVSILRAYDYCKELKYKDVLEDQNAISKMLLGTEKSFVTGQGFNSVIKLLSLSQSAQIKTIDDPNEQFKMQLFQLSSQMDDISTELRSLRNKERSMLLKSEMDNDKFSERILNKKLHEAYSILYDDFLKFYQLGDIDGMMNVYKQYNQRTLRTSKDVEITSEMRKMIAETKENNDRK